MSDLGKTGQVLRSARQAGRAALVTYLPVGFPTVANSYEALRIVAEAADLVEIGMPYSDPMMDGVTIQYATKRALERGVRTRDLFGACETVARVGKFPLVMTYWNIVERYGVDAFARDLAAAGGAGLITPDLTPDEADEWVVASNKYGLDRIFLIAPSSTEERIRYTMESCRGWVYATSVMGVTGTRSKTSAQAPVIVERARKVSDLPVGVGLGVSSAEQASEVAGFADGVIVGSALLKTLIEDEGAPGRAALADLVAELAVGVRSVKAR